MIWILRMIWTPVVVLVYTTTAASLADHTMSGRNIFSETEKACLMELIIKYKLHKPSTSTPTSQSAKKVLWQRLTQEYNAIEGNSKRTDVQLKKLYDNLKTRQKSLLTEEKRERMRTGGGQYMPNEPGTSGSAETLVAEALNNNTDVEIVGVFDSDTYYDSTDAVVIEMVETSESQDLSNPQINTQSPPRCDTAPPPRRDTTPPARRETPPRRPVSQQTDFGAAPFRGPRNVRSKVIEEEFHVRQQAYENKEKREEELFEIQKKERLFMMMAAEQTYLAAKESYMKVKAEKEAAEELLRCNRAKRELAERELQIKKIN